MTRTYAIPDIHGRLDLLELALERIADHAAAQGGKIITLGDYIDRGPSSRQVIERLMNCELDGFDFVNLKGNHEVLMLAVCLIQAELEWWLRNGGGETLSSYGEPAISPNLRNLPATHLDWMANLPLLHVDRYRVFVHAAVDPEISLDDQNEETLLWRRYPRGWDNGHGSRYVVHGHDADPRGPSIGKSRANLDALAWRTGRLAIGVFEDDRPGGPSEILEVVGPSAKGARDRRGLFSR
jgi:serine/threonine protein phosphatase 1